MYGEEMRARQARKKLVRRKACPGLCTTQLLAEYSVDSQRPSLVVDSQRPSPIVFVDGLSKTAEVLGGLLHLDCDHQAHLLEITVPGTGSTISVDLDASTAAAASIHTT